MDYLSNLCKVAEAVEPVANSKMAACVVYKGRIISYGVNQRKSHPMQKKYAVNEHRIYLHAEVSALLNAMKHLTADELAKSILYVARVKHPDNNNMEWVSGLAKPCDACQTCLDSFSISKVVYTT